MFCTTSQGVDTCYFCHGPDSSPRDATCKPDLNTTLVICIEFVAFVTMMGMCVAYSKYKQQSRNNPERQPLLNFFSMI